MSFQILKVHNSEKQDSKNITQKLSCDKYVYFLKLQKASYLKKY